MHPRAEATHARIPTAERADPSLTKRNVIRDRDNVARFIGRSFSKRRFWAPQVPSSGGRSRVVAKGSWIGSEEHKRLFCETFVRTHRAVLARFDSLARPRRGESRAPQGPADLERSGADGSRDGAGGADPRSGGARSGSRRSHRTPGLRRGPPRRAPRFADAALRHSGRAVRSPRAAPRPGLGLHEHRVRRVPRLLLRVWTLRAGEAVALLPRSVDRHFRSHPPGGGAAHPLHRQLGGVPEKSGPVHASPRLRRPPLVDDRETADRPREEGGPRSESPIRRKASR